MGLVLGRSLRRQTHPNCGRGSMLDALGKEPGRRFGPTAAYEEEQQFDGVECSAKVAAFFEANLGVLRAQARAIGGGLLDGEDLLSEAMLAVLERCAKGGPPPENIYGYVTKTMRNRVKDELKSPRSRVVASGILDEGVSTSSEEELLVDVKAESGLVRASFERLPEEYKAVLLHMTVLGNKPRQLAPRLNRTPAAVSSLHRRAKLRLRREVLVQLLSEQAPSECAKHLEDVPEEFPDSPAHAEAGKLEHFKSCNRCGAAWSRFGGLVSAFGILPLLVVGASFARESIIGPLDFQAESEQWGSGDAGNVSDLEATTTVIADAATTFSTSSYLNSSRGEGTGRQRRAARRASSIDRKRHQNRIASLAATFMGETLVYGAVIVSVAGLTMPSQCFADAQVKFQVEPVINGPGNSIVVQIDLPVESWRVDLLELTMSSSAVSVEAPPGWSCLGGGLIWNCSTSTQNANGGSFVIDGGVAGTNSRINVRLSASTPQGCEVNGEAEVELSRSASRTNDAVIEM